MIGERIRPYSLLLRLHRRILAEGYGLDGLLLAIALVYIFGARASLDLTLSRGIFLLAGFTFAALLHGERVRRSAAPLSFYLRLPARRRPALLLFYAATTLPPAAALAGAFLLLRAALPDAIQAPPPVLRERLLQALFGLLFVRSLTVNLMVAVRIHAALVAAYFVALLGILVYLFWLREVLLPFFELTPPLVGLLFLGVTYGISLLAVRRVGF